MNHNHNSIPPYRWKIFRLKIYRLKLFPKVTKMETLPPEYFPPTRYVSLLPQSININCHLHTIRYIPPRLTSSFNYLIPSFYRIKKYCSYQKLSQFKDYAYNPVTSLPDPYLPELM